MTFAVIDAAVFGALRANLGAEFATELVDTFATEAPQLLAELRAARQEGNADRFRRAAHALKSNGSAFGASRFAEQARALELGGLPPDGLSTEALAQAFEQALAELRRLCAK